ncbi:MAG TPA: heme biosynthesis HemY N-terminal domain-containing protein, partial [Stellaceae bacterium]|nr:heme biosynthesis HemY N-terminal domain-containing protein [Stellaceae bacterium]
MRRLLAFVLLVVLAVAAATVADHPGTVVVTWQGWEINTSVGVLAAALVVVALALWLLILLLAGLVRLPRRFRRNRRERRRRAGELALTRGMIALSAGDGAGAQRHAARAELLLGG